MKIQRLQQNIPVGDIYWKLQQNPHLWDEHTERTASPNSPHHELNDIWARYGDPAHAVTGQPHTAHWYPAADVLGI